jgi:putative ABC transport system permease protein
MMMFRNHIKLAWRNLIKHKVYSLINITGLTIGIAGILFVGSFIYSEISVNHDVRNNSRIYMVQSKWKDPDLGYDFATLAPISKALKENYPNLVADYYHHDGITSIISKGDKKFSEGLQVGDSTFLSMFGFELLQGNAKTALNNPNSMALTAAMAKKYFGRTDVLGETLTIQSFSGSKQEFEIKAVLKDPPFNTITNWGDGINNGANEFFLPASSLRFFGRDAGFESWQNAFIISYVELKEGVDPSSLLEPVKYLTELNASEHVRKNLEVYFTPVKDYYLSSNNGIAFRMIYALGIVAFFILLMAVINFVNITIGNSFHRIREIGVRKVMGSTKVQLTSLFLTESILLCAFAMTTALLIYVAGRAYVGEILGKQLPALSSFPVYFMLLIMLLVVVVGFLAGSFPAFILSSQASVSSLKGKLGSVGEKIILRKGMISLQFIVAIVVFTAAVVIDKQVDFFFHKDLGYDRERVITARVPRDWTPQGVQKMEMIRNEFSTLPEVAGASFSFEIPDGASAGKNNIIFKASQDSASGIIAESLFTDEKYLSTYVIPLAAGEFFNEKGGLVDSATVVLNSAAAKALGWDDPGSAINQLVKFQGNQTIFRVTGVVKDFHFGPLQQRIQPLYFIHVKNAPLFRYLSFRLHPGNTSKEIAAIQSKWASLFPDAPFDYKFIDETLARLYLTETRMKKAASLATIVSLIIVLLGVSGIVAQNISRRTKEVGIRKVLGASVSQIITLFAKDFVPVVFIANLAAWPLAFVLLRNWLDNYAYRVDLTPLPFAIVTMIVLALIALLITYKVSRIATESPVKSLRTE